MFPILEKGFQIIFNEKKKDNNKKGTSTKRPISSFYLCIFPFLQLLLICSIDFRSKCQMKVITMPSCT